MTISAPPPSVMTQQSSRCSGSATIGEFTTSSTVTTSRSMACGLCCAWCEAATLIQASCSDVVPNSCMWRIAHMRVHVLRRARRRVSKPARRASERPAARRRAGARPSACAAGRPA